MASLSSLLLTRLPAPVVRVDFRALQKCLSSPTSVPLKFILGRPSSALPSVEAQLIERCQLRTSPAVLSALERLWESACLANDRADGSFAGRGTLSKPAFAHFYRLLSYALLNRIDEHSVQVMAECEWALGGGGTDEMTNGAFCEWMYDIIEGWSSEGNRLAVASLAEELIEAVATRSSHVATEFVGVPEALRPPEEVEWLGLLRFRDASAPPTALNWSQVRRLVDAARRWRAWEPPTTAQLMDLASGKMALPALPSPRMPPSAVITAAERQPRIASGGLWRAHTPESDLRASSFPTSLPLPPPMHGPNASPGRRSPGRRTPSPLHEYEGGEAAAGGSSRGSPPKIDSDLPVDRRTHLPGGDPHAPMRAPTQPPRSPQERAALERAMMPHSSRRPPQPQPPPPPPPPPHATGGTKATAIVVDSATYGAPTSATVPTRAAPSAGSLSARPPRRDGGGYGRRGGGGRPSATVVAELGAMRVGAPPQAFTSPRAPQGAAHGGGGGGDAAAAGKPIGLGLASERVDVGVGAERTAFSGHRLFEDTLRKRERMMAQAASQAKARTLGQSPRARAHAATAGSAPPPAAADAPPPQQPVPPPPQELQASIATVESQYARMDRELLRHLTDITRDELAAPFDAARNRQLNSDLQLGIQLSRQRVSSLTYKCYDPDGVTPTSARAALKEGVRTPLELVRSEVRARQPIPRQQHAALSGRGSVVEQYAPGGTTPRLPPVA